MKRRPIKDKLVLLPLDTEGSFPRGILRGIAQYARLHGPWEFYRQLPLLGLPIDERYSFFRKNVIANLRKAGIDGIIMRDDDDIKKEILKMGLPAILVTPQKAHDKLPGIFCNEVAIGKMAAEHLVDRGLKQFAFCGLWDDPKREPWVKARYDGFSKALSETGFRCDFFKLPVYLSEEKWKNTAKQLDQWLKSLPKPVGIMTCNDECGVYILESCKRTGLHMPEDIAVIGVDNDELLCELFSFPLSSIALNTVKSGYDAAELLDKLMNGQKMEGQKIIIDPTKIVVRQSSDILKIDDKEVRDALRLIQKYARESIQTQEIVNLLPISRQSLHKRFIKELGRSIHDEIRRVRIGLVTQMLIETNVPISQISLDLGFSSIKHLSRYFKAMYGCTPSEYRQKMRPQTISMTSNF